MDDVTFLCRKQATRVFTDIINYLQSGLQPENSHGKAPKSINSTLLDVFRIIRVWDTLSCLFTLQECFAQYYHTVGQLLQHIELQCHGSVSTEMPMRGITVSSVHESACWDMLCVLQQCIAMAKAGVLGLPYPVM